MWSITNAAELIRKIREGGAHSINPIRWAWWGGSTRRNAYTGPAPHLTPRSPSTATPKRLRGIAAVHRSPEPQVTTPRSPGGTANARRNQRPGLHRGYESQ